MFSLFVETTHNILVKEKKTHFNDYCNTQIATTKYNIVLNTKFGDYIEEKSFTGKNPLQNDQNVTKHKLLKIIYHSYVETEKTTQNPTRKS